MILLFQINYKNICYLLRITHFTDTKNRKTKKTKKTEMDKWMKILNKKGLGSEQSEKSEKSDKIDYSKLDLTEKEENTDKNNEQLKTELIIMKERIKRRDKIILGQKVKIKELHYENEKMNKLSLMKGEKLLNYFDEKEKEECIIIELKNQIKDMQTTTKKLLVAALDELQEKTDKIETLERELLLNKQLFEEFNIKNNQSKKIIKDYENNLNRCLNDLEMWMEIGIKQNWLFEKMKSVGLQQSEDIFECFEDIKIPETSTFIKEKYIPTDETSNIDIVSSDEEEEYYREDIEIEQIYLSYHAIKIQKIFRGYLVRKEYPFSLDSI